MNVIQHTDQGLDTDSIKLRRMAKKKKKKKKIRCEN